LGASPRIDEFARSGVRFERAYAHAPWTLPAVASILTSLYPPQHGAGGYLPRFRRLPDAARTLAEHFRDAGYATAEVINVDFLSETFGMTQGFEQVYFQTYASNIHVPTATETTNAALAWLSSRPAKPFFLLVHYFDPHLVYAPPSPFRERFAEPVDRLDSSWVFGTRRDIVAFRRGVRQFDDATIRRAERLYDGEIAYTDSEVGRLLDGLETLDLDDDTVVALSSDHGEEFLDHGSFEHGHSLFDELVRVPLIIRARTDDSARIVTATVGHVDLAPTLCELAGIEPDSAFVGQSLVALMNGNDGEGRPALFQGNFWSHPLQGWFADGYKLILAEGRSPLLFNLIDDPLELHDLAGSQPDLRIRMTEALERARDEMLLQGIPKDQPVQLSPETLQRLRSLGYAD
jgi:arylsulfatase A-like enzyme